MLHIASRLSARINVIDVLVAGTSVPAEGRFGRPVHYNKCDNEVMQCL
jgi:hypothetical protein